MKNKPKEEEEEVLSGRNRGKRLNRFVLSPDGDILPWTEAGLLLHPPFMEILP